MKLKAWWAALSLCPVALAAAETPEPLNPVVVTATRTAQTVDETLTAVTVITRADLERAQAQTLQDALRSVPGVALANTGGAGKATTAFLRGTNSSHVLVLIDGVKVGSATTALTPFQDLPVEQIERIEVVRGPRSSLDGSEAIGGVIQIFTRKGGGALRPSFSVGAGSDETYHAAAALSGGGRNGWFNAGADLFDTEGFNACNGDPVTFAGCATLEPDRDGNRRRGATLRAGYRFAPNAEFEVHALSSHSKTEFDGSFQNSTETDQQVIGGRLSASPIKPWQVTLQGGQSRDESDNFRNGAFATRFDTERDSLSLQNDIALDKSQTLTVGLDRQTDRVTSTTRYAVRSRDNDGLFVQYQGQFGAHDVQLSVRRDDNEQFGNETTGGAAWGYALNERLRLFASWGSAFKAPSFNDLYFPAFGNPNLEPETSRSVELGLRGKHARGHWSTHVFQTQIDDLIGFDPTTFRAVNVDAARIRGAEAEVVGRWSAWDARANLTLLDPENQSPGANHGKRLARRAEQVANVELDRRFGTWQAGLTLHAEGKRYDDPANRYELPAYGTLDLRAEYAIAPDWRLQGRIGNLFDADYETARLYNQPGRNFMVTLRYQPAGK